MDAEWFGMPVDTEMRTVIQERKHHIATVLRVIPTYQELRHAGKIATNCLKSVGEPKVQQSSFIILLSKRPKRTR